MTILMTQTTNESKTKNFSMENFAEYAKQNISMRNHTSICFLGYITLYYTKQLLVKSGFSEDTMYKYLERPLTHTEDKKAFILKDKIVRNSFKLNNINEALNSVDSLLQIYKLMTDKKTYERIISTWNDIGLEDIKKEAKTNEKHLNAVIDMIDSIDNFNIKILIDMYEELNVTSKYYNDFFTPNDISAAIALIAKEEDFSMKKTINLYEPSIGIGRIMYHTFIELKEKHPNKTINIFGIDLNPRFKAFSESIFNLINFNHTFIEHGNTLKDNFDFPKMDLCISNPPFDKKRIEFRFVEHIESFNCKSIMVLPNGFGFIEKEKALRKRLIDNDRIEGIIQLPEKMFKNTDIATQIVILRKDYQSEVKEYFTNMKYLSADDFKKNLQSMQK